MNNNMKFVIAFLCFYLPLQLSYSAGIVWDHQQRKQSAIEQVKNRIALDLPRLSLPNERLHIMGNPEAIVTYLTQLNVYLSEHRFGLQVTQLQEVVGKSASLPTVEAHTFHLVTPDNHVIGMVSFEPIILSAHLSVWPLLITGLLIWLSRYHIVRWRAPEQESSAVLEPDIPLVLQLNLKDKTLVNSITEQAVPLANKPLCFYIALLEYCLNNKEITLNQNKDVPIELVELANKYFYRLVELGHTVRKRPNFTNSLEKTLSEIRAALDEVFAEHPEEKEIYYPPKAHGEGSRSKLHHYGLNKVVEEHFEIIGR